MICLPSFEEEWVVTVVREDPEDLDGPHTYYVECVVAERKLFPPKKSQGVKAKKTRAPIDGETAESLNRVWAMLRTPRHPKKAGLGADGVDYHFSRFLPLIDCGRPDPVGGWEEGDDLVARRRVFMRPARGDRRAAEGICAGPAGGPGESPPRDP